MVGRKFRHGTAYAAGRPTLLQAESGPLVGDRIKDLQTNLGLLRAMVANDGPASASYAYLKALIQDAAEVITAMTRAEDLDTPGTSLHAVADYLDLTAVPVEAAATHWAQSHAVPTHVADYLAEVSARLFEPMISASSTMASVRGSYNIAPLYLYRLVHGFDAERKHTPMDIAAKGIASECATRSMHRPNFRWLIEWHEAELAALDETMSDLNEDLCERLGCTEDVLHFCLRDDRAIFTALGKPSLGQKDWDCSVLINPNLSAEDWYSAFAAVNDTVLGFLDRARFTYSELINRNAASLSEAVEEFGGAEPSPDLEDLRYYARLALLAEHCADIVQTPAPKKSGKIVNLYDYPRSTAMRNQIHGELIDIAIPKRDTVGLFEQWVSLAIIKRKGVSGRLLPVPSLPSLLGELVGLARECLDAAMAGKTLASRLEKLSHVISTDDPDLVAMLKRKSVDVMAIWPRTARALDADGQEPSGRLAAWMLADLAASLRVSAARTDGNQTRDTDMARALETLFNAAAGDSYWEAMSPHLPGELQHRCRELLATLRSVHHLAHCTLDENLQFTSVIGGPDRASGSLWPLLNNALLSAMSQNGLQPGVGYRLTGGLAARLHNLQAGRSQAADPVGEVEVIIAPQAGELVPMLKCLAADLSRSLSPHGLLAEVSNREGSPCVDVRGEVLLDGNVDSWRDVTLMSLRPPATKGENAARVEVVQGWPAASVEDLLRLYISRAAACADYSFRQEYRALVDRLRYWVDETSV